MMSRPILVDLFVEDRAHREFLASLIPRIAEEVGLWTTLRVRTAHGGHPRALKEYRAFQSLLAKSLLTDSTPELLIVAIDGNCSSFADIKSLIENATRPEYEHMLVVACPDPHIERWYIAHPESFFEVVGQRPVVPARVKCDRGHYKMLLQNAIRAAGHPSTLSGVEFASDIVSAMDLYRAGKRDSSFKAFVDDLRGKLVRLRVRE